jgi:hypothetical protein
MWMTTDRLPAAAKSSTHNNVGAVIQTDRPKRVRQAQLPSGIREMPLGIA